MDAPEPSVAPSGVAQSPIPAAVLASAIQELATPLELIASHTELVLRSIDPAAMPAECMDSIEEIRVLAVRARRRVRNISHFARLERMDIRALELNGLVGETARLLEPDLRLHRVSIKLDLSPELPAFWGSEAPIRHALANLIENAAEAMTQTPPAEREVLVATRFTSEGVAIEVCDRGCEFPPDGEDRVFDPFFTTKPAGMGLGLSVVRQIIQAHGGKVVAARRGGGGMVIRISLPIRRRPAEDSASAESLA